jgi:hypothetical protein
MVTKKQTTTLAHASAAARFHRLITDETQPAEARHDLLEWFDQMCNHTEVNLEHPAFFPKAFLMAAKGTEEMPRKKRGKNLDAAWAWQAYDEIQKTLARTKAGESLAAIYAEREAARERRQAAREAENLNAPEPKDKTSDEWRYWKLRRLERAFAGRREDGEAYAEAWREFRALLDGLLADEDFWHTGNARALLPTLIIARQRIDETRAFEKRQSAAAKGTAARRKKAGAA